MTTRYRVMVILGLLLAVGFITVSIVGYFMARETVSEQIRSETLPLTSVSIFSQIQQDLTRPILISSLMAQDTFVHEWIEDGEMTPLKMTRYLRRIQTQNGASTAFFVSERSRRYFHSTGVLRTVSASDPQDAWFFRTRDMDADYEINVDIDTQDLKSLTVFINHKVKDEQGRFLGITGIGISVTSMEQMIRTYRNLHGLNVLFAARDGTIKLSGDHMKAYGTLQEIDGLADHVEGILSASRSQIAYNRLGMESYLEARIVPEFDWYLIVEEQESPWDSRLVLPVFIYMMVGMVVTGTVLYLVYRLLDQHHRQLEEMATTDKLTGTANRHGFEMIAEQIVKVAKRKDAPFSALVMDLDHFKRVNDNFGHAAGDAVLQGIVWVARRSLRESDVIIRWGGEEFLILLGDCNEEQSYHIAEKIRSAIANHATLFEGHQINITVSLGAAQWYQGDTENDVVIRADKALIAAKQKGRNVVVRASDEDL